MTDRPEPGRLTDVDLLAWAVVIEHRHRLHARSNNIILPPYPPCPTCGENVYGIDTYHRWDRFDSRLTTQPCGHVHAVDEAQVDRIHRHIGDMLELLDTASRWPAGEGWTAERIIAEARARVGQSEQAAAEPVGAVCTVTVTVHAPTPENAASWAQAISDLVTAEYGQDMRLSIQIGQPKEAS